MELKHESVGHKGKVPTGLNAAWSQIRPVDIREMEEVWSRGTT
jgi:hypothetical protein